MGQLGQTIGVLAGIGKDSYKGIAVDLRFGRVLSVFLLVLFGLAGTARADHFLTHPAATPQAVKAAARDARTLFGRAGEIKVKRDAKVYITPQNIPKNYPLLKVYSADKATEGTSAPGLFRIATQAYRSQASGDTTKKAYSLADAMRDAVWRKKTSAMLKSLMSTQRSCAEGADDTSRGALSIGLGAIC